VVDARQKTYQTTKLMELRAGQDDDFCFVVQLGDIAYVAVAYGRVPNKMIVGDPIQIRIKDDKLFVRTEDKWSYAGNQIKGQIRVRQRMTGDAKPPSCALAVTIHSQM
jgi:hypothetical protein